MPEHLAIKKIVDGSKGDIDSNRVIIGNFNTPLSPWDRLARHNISKETIELVYTIDLWIATENFIPQFKKIHYFYWCIEPTLGTVDHRIN